MKRRLELLAIALTLILLSAFLVPLAAQAQVVFPGRGGTGTSTAPTLGQILMGQANGTYAPQATSTLGLITTDVAEGSNLYFTDARVGSYLTASTTLPAFLNYWTKDATKLSYTGGNVGIGTTTPSYPLDVNGIINASSTYNIRATQMLYLPNQTEFIGSSFFGNGGESLSRTTGNEGRYNTGVGLNALRFLTTGLNNTAFGYNAMEDLTTGTFNVALGANSLFQNTTGSYNMAIGDNALGTGTTTTSTVGIGWQSGLNFNGDTSVFIGHQAGRANAYYAASGITAVGFQAGYGGSGNNGTFIGYRAGLSIASGGTNNVFIGYQAGDNVTTGDNNLVVGYNIDAPSATASNQLNIGNAIFGAGISGTGTTLAGTIGVGTTTPAAKFSIMNTLGGSTPLFMVASSTSGAGTTTPFIVTSSGGVGAGTVNPRAGVTFTIGGSQSGNATVEYVMGSSATIQCLTTSLVYCANSFDGSTTNFRSSATSGTWQTFRALTTTLAGATTGASFDYSTSITNTAQNFTGIALTTHAVTAASANTLRGITLSPGAITNSAGATTYVGVDITMPAITQTAGTLTSTGLKITGGTVTSGTSYALLTDAAAGSVGIGTLTPAGLLDVAGIVNISGAEGANGLRWSSGDAEISEASYNLMFKTWTGSDLTEKMRITGAGNVGIGTTTPGTLLDLFSTGTTTLRIDSNSTTKGGCLAIKDSDGGGYTYVTALDGVLSASVTPCS